MAFNLDDMVKTLDERVKQIQDVRRLVCAIQDQLKLQRVDFLNLVESAKKFSVLDPNCDIVSFNVGGTRFSTLKSTITKRVRKQDGQEDELYEENLLSALVNGYANVKLDETKAIFIDRSPKYFELIIDYLRKANTDETFEFPTSDSDAELLLREADYYKIHGLRELYTGKKSFESEILDAKEVVDLIKLCRFKRSDNWKLILRGSRDGFESSTFHDKCDGMSKTLVLVKSTDGWIFGGYTEVEWGSDGTWSYDSNAFIFSFRNREDLPIIFKSLGDKSSYSHGKFGPTFGSGYDLYIADRCNTNAGSYSNLGYSYKVAGENKFIFGSIEANTFLNGSFNFQVENYEVYQKIE